MHAQDAVTTADTILDLVRRWADAERSLDAQPLAPLLADDFILVGPRGFMLGKQQFLSSRRSGDLKHASFTLDDVQVRIYDDAAIAIGTQTQQSTFQGRDASGQFRVTLIAVQQQPRWVLAGVHLSAIGVPPGGPP
jgi:uncharacterized protein (TIGR02246 family)